MAAVLGAVDSVGVWAGKALVADDLAAGVCLGQLAGGQLDGAAPQTEHQVQAGLCGCCRQSVRLSALCPQHQTVLSGGMLPLT